jgi:serine palmitoyltransferase
VLDCVEALTIPYHATSPIIHIQLHSATPPVKPANLNPATPAAHDALPSDIAGEERLLQDVVDKALAQGMWITRARRQHATGQELVEVRPSIRLAFTAAQECKECKRTTAVIKAAVAKVLTKRK